MTDVMQTLGDPSQSLLDAEQRMRRGDLAAALVGVRRLLSANPDFKERWANLSWLAEQIGDFDGALMAAQRYFTIDPLSPIAGLKVAELMSETGRVEGALGLVETIADQRPGDAAPQYYAGVLGARLGEFGGAEERLRRSLAYKPDLTPAWEQIAALKTFTDPADRDLAVMEALNTRLAAADPQTRAPLLYALGKAYEDLGDHARAFAAYAEGARLISAERPWLNRGFEALVDETVRDFDRALMNRQPPSAVESDRPIFLMGAPRSGTALVEQVLASCPGVRGGGGINLFRLATLPLGEHRPSRLDEYAEATANAGSPDFWTRFAGNYLAFLDERFGFESRIVDRTLNHTSFAGSLRLAFPKAPILWVRRDPYDVAWSCFRTRFLRGHDWSWSLPDIARYLHQMDRLHAHWTEVLGADLQTFEYEALVKKPAEGTASLAAAAGVEAGPEASAFHLTRRATDSASLVALRKPMTRERVGAWRPYEAQLEPFIRVYESFKAGSSEP
jgi:tetratricopeptide (TPR) repeat protein